MCGSVSSYLYSFFLQTCKDSSAAEEVSVDKRRVDGERRKVDPEKVGEYRGKDVGESPSTLVPVYFLFLVDCVVLFKTLPVSEHHNVSSCPDQPINPSLFLFFLQV